MGSRPASDGQVSDSPPTARSDSKLTIFDSATPVLRGGPFKGKPANMPDHPPPNGYICYRCGEKGHWIQACPTNDDPTFDGRPRVKRTTGIPRSFLKTVEKPSTQTNDGTVDDTKQPSGIMINAEGEWVVAEPDKAAWDRFQAKAKVSAAAEKAAAQGSKELQEKGLECSIDKRLFVNPVKTPCCHKTFCHECITNALVENDLRCPECSTEDVPIDDLSPDAETAEKVQNYLAGQVVKLDREAQKDVSDPNVSPQKENILNIKKAPSPQKSLTPDCTSKKRPADTELKNEHKPAGPKEVSNTSIAASSQSSTESSKPITSNSTTSQYPFSNFPNGDTMQGGFNPMAFPNMNGMTAMPPNMAAMGMNFGMPNQMMMGSAPFMNNDWSNMFGGGFGQPGMGNGMPNGMMPNMLGPQGMYNQMGNNGVQMNGMGQPNQQHHFFANQQRTSFGNQNANDEDSPYFRKPVNPHRHQARRNINRPTDYREI